MSVASESVQVGRKVSAVKWLSGTLTFDHLSSIPERLPLSDVVPLILPFAGFSAAELGGSSRLLATGTWDDRDNRLQVWLVEGPTVSSGASHERTVACSC